MAAIFWNDSLREESGGLDILGVRGVDQRLEASLAGGITTITIRARYISHLVWILAEWVQREAAEGVAQHDETGLGHAIGRLEFLIAATTSLSASNGESRGIIGADDFGPLIKALKKDGIVELPEEESWGSYNTYWQLCKTLGVIQSPPTGSVAPVIISPSGQSLWQARTKALAGNQLAELVFTGGSVTLEMLNDGENQFSLKDIQSCPEEAALLTELYRGTQAPELGENRKEFARTLSWLLRALNEKPSNSTSLSARALVESRTDTNDPSALHWGEVEFRRRIHYGLELLLASFSTELKAECTDGKSSASIEEVVAAWTEEGPVAEIVSSSWPSSGKNWLENSEVAFDDIDTISIWDGEMGTRIYSDLTPREQAIAGIMLISACERVSRNLRDTNRFPERSYLGEKALAVVRETDGGSLINVLTRLLAQVVVPAHLTTTLRKMGGGMKCSLRFFPDANGYRPTEIETSPGFSGDRLRNVISMLRDVGVLDLTDGGYVLTGNGTELLNEIAA